MCTCMKMHSLTPSLFGRQENIILIPHYCLAQIVAGNSDNKPARKPRMESGVHKTTAAASPASTKAGSLQARRPSGLCRPRPAFLSPSGCNAVSCTRKKNMKYDAGGKSCRYSPFPLQKRGGRADSAYGCQTADHSIRKSREYRIILHFLLSYHFSNYGPQSGYGAQKG